MEIQLTDHLTRSERRAYESARRSEALAAALSRIAPTLGSVARLHGGEAGGPASERQEAEATASSLIGQEEFVAKARRLGFRSGWPARSWIGARRFQEHVRSQLPEVPDADPSQQDEHTVDLRLLVPAMRLIESGELQIDPFMQMGKATWDTLASLYNDRLAEDERAHHVLPWADDIHTQFRNAGWRTFASERLQKLYDSTRSSQNYPDTPQ